MPSGSSSSSFKNSGNNQCPRAQPPTWRQETQQIEYNERGQTVDTQICFIRFSIPDNLNPPVLLYYRLTNFYQNHRRYVKSLDMEQLKGTAVSAKNIDGGSCDPLRLEPGTGKPYYPCGLIANSVFNDTFGNLTQLNVHDSNDQNRTYNMTNSGIAWDSDKDLYGETKYKAEEVAVPPNWVLRYPNGYTNDNLPNLKNDEALQVWMRTAGLPAFSKLALRNDKETMQCSTYEIQVRNSKCFTTCGNRESVERITPGFIAKRLTLVPC